MNERRNVPEIVIAICELLRRSQTRINLLFTMSEIPHAHPAKDATCEVMFRGRYLDSKPCLRGNPSAFNSIWWSQTGSNRRPHACKARALPAELWPPTRRRMPLVALAFARATAQRPSFKRASRAEAAEQRRLVGLGRLELPTSRLSSARSNQLSYKPLTLSWKRIRSRSRAPTCAGYVAQAQPLARVRPRRKRNEDGEIPPMELNNPEIVGP
jgi:hypothetical protein